MNNNKTLKLASAFLVTCLPFTTVVAAIDADLQACSTLNNDELRLACYDSWVELNNSGTASIKPVPASDLSSVVKTAEPVAVVSSSAAVIATNTASSTVDVATITNANTASTVKPSVSAPSPAKISPVSTTEAASLEDNFGMEHVKTIEEEKIKDLQYTISKAKKSIHGKWTLDFTNGQRWTTITSERMKFKADQEVTITRGVLNSFILSPLSSNRSTKVKRIK